MPNPEFYNSKPELLIRQLNLFDSTMMMVGLVIGSGIFLTTGIMAQSIPSAGLILLTWIVGGFLTLAGALTFAELGAAMPEAGGQYVYLREAYGHLYGFLFGWVLFLVAMGGSIAALAVGFAEYLSYFFPALSMDNIIFSTRLFSLSIGKLVAICAIVILSIINYIGAGFGKIIQNIFTVLKIGSILGLILFGFLIGNTTSFSLNLSPVNYSFGQLFFGFGIALIAVSWAFDGWHNLNYIAGEIKNPKRNIPLALLFGTLIITTLYVLANVVYLLALPINEISGVVRIAEKTSSALFGNVGASILSAIVIISTFGALNGGIFVGPRVYYAMAKDKVFFKKVSEIHPKFKTPGFAIILQVIWTCILTVSGTYEQLFTFTMFTTIIFWIAGTASVFTLRKKYPDLERPYKTWGYPFVPLIFIIASSGILLNTLINRPVESLAGLGLTAVGIPVYYYWKKKGANYASK